jgi:hypothetical protein
MVYVVDAVRPEVPPVAVMVFAPPVVSATTNAAAPVWQDPAPVTAEPPGVLPAVQVVLAAKDAVVKAVVAKVIASAEPKPVAEICSVTVDSGKPKLLPAVVLIETFELMVNGALTEFVPSLTTMV